PDLGDGRAFEPQPAGLKANGSGLGGIGQDKVAGDEHRWIVANRIAVFLSQLPTPRSPALPSSVLSVPPWWHFLPPDCGKLRNYAGFWGCELQNPRFPAKN